MPIIGWGLGIDPDAYSIWHSSQYPQGFNYMGYSNPRVDRYLEEGRRVSDQKKRQIYETCIKKLPRCTVLLFVPSQVITAAHKRLGGLVPNPGPLGIINYIGCVYKAMKIIFKRLLTAILS